MDPNAALIAILRGHEVADHVDALRGWLGGYGFKPQVQMPDDCLPQYREFLGRWITATGTGIFYRDDSESYQRIVLWGDLS